MQENNYCVKKFHFYARSTPNTTTVYHKVKYNIHRKTT